MSTDAPSRGRMRRMQRITRKHVQSHPNAMFIFGDNMDRRGLGGQAAAMRGEPNAIGIPTKWSPSMQRDAFFSDGDPSLPLAIDAVKKALWEIESALIQGKDVVLPAAGVGSGLSELQARAPNFKTFIDRSIAALERRYG